MSARAAGGIWERRFAAALTRASRASPSRTALTRPIKKASSASKGSLSRSFSAAFLLKARRSARP